MAYDNGSDYTGRRRDGGERRMRDEAYGDETRAARSGERPHRSSNYYEEETGEERYRPRKSAGGSYGASRHSSASGNRTRSTGSSGSGGSGYRSGGSGSHKKKKKRRRYRLRIQPRFYFLAAIAVVFIAIVVVAISAITKKGAGGQEAAAKTPKPGIFAELFKTPTPSPTPSPSPTPTPTPTPPYDLPHAVDATQPSKLGVGVKVEVNGAVAESYQRAEEIHFGYDEKYTNLQGIITFRGDNFRSGASFGAASISERRLSEVWKVETGELGRSDVSGPTERTWTGSGWVGQPLIVQWPAATKQHMNMYDWAKSDDSLVEVIYATMDGCIYFLDLSSGRATRDKLSLGMPFKGAGALDPRGYPILYIGSGDMYVSDAQKARGLVISLLDFTRLYEFGKQNDEFSLRDWHAYDSSALVDAKTDTLIYPGENGILYTIKLNTQYDEAAGTLSVNPSDVVKMRYTGSRSTYPESGSNLFWLGYESSVSVLGGYAYLGTNDGFLQCINLNTMEMVWVQDIKDDTNGSPVLEMDLANRAAYIYIGPSLHFTADSEKQGVVSFYKINAITGEVVWKYDQPVITKSGVSGGIQATALLGKNSISDLVLIPFARTPSEDSGVLVALEKATGKVRWTYPMEKYTWSSPVAVYDSAGNAYVVQCEGSDTGGKIFLLDGKTGTLLSTFDAEKNIEASPAVYGNMIVVGTRGMRIWGVKIS